MPKLIRLYIINVAIGFAIAVAFVAALIWLDVGASAAFGAGNRNGLARRHHDGDVQRRSCLQAFSLPL